MAFVGVRAEPIIVIPGLDPVEVVQRNIVVPRPVLEVVEERSESDDEVEIEHVREPVQREHVQEYVQPARVREHVREHVHQAEPKVNIDAALDAMDPVDTHGKFWTIISSLNWRNMGEGVANAAAARRVINNLKPANRAVFKDMYKFYFMMLNGLLVTDGMFDRNNIDTFEDKAKIVSHVIGLGHDTFETMMADLAFLQFLVEAGECQSLDAALPDDIQCI